MPRHLALSLIALTMFAGALRAQTWSTMLPAPQVEDFDQATPTSYGSPACVTNDPGILPPGWSLDPSASAMWIVNTGATGGSITGPQGDHTSGSGNYVYAESSCGSSNIAATAILNGPCYDVSALGGHPNLEVWYHMRGFAIGSLAIESWTGSAWRELRRIEGQQGNQWLRAQVGLYVFDNGGTPASTFRFVCRHSSLVSAFGDLGLDDVTIQAGPLRPEWQVNSSAMSLDIDGVLARRSEPAIVDANIFLCPSIVYPVNMLTVSSDLPGAAYDLVIGAGSCVGGQSGGLDLGDQTFVNVDLTAPTTTFLSNGGALFLPPAAPGSSEATFSLSFSPPTPLRVCVQGVVLDGSLPTGFALSQASELGVATAIPPVTLAGPTMDDEALTIDVAAGPVCWSQAGLPFFGTVYDEIHVSPNGFVTFPFDSSSASASVSGAASGPARAGFWTDLDPSAGGTVTLSQPGPNRVRIDYLAVPNATGAPNTFAIEIDGSTGIVTLSGLQGLMATTGVTNRDRQWLGLSPGIVFGGGGDLGVGPGGTPASDPGPAGFAPGASGTAGSPRDMIYQFNDPAASMNGLLPSLQAGLDSIVFTPDGNGSYSWTCL